MGGSLYPELGEVDRVDLDIHQGTDLVFAFEWWADAPVAGDPDVPVLIADCRGAVKESARESSAVLVDLAQHSHIVDNVCTIRLAGDYTQDLPPLDRAVWDYMIKSVNGEWKPVGRGIVKVHRSVS